jgi:hypothetical protein
MSGSKTISKFGLIVIACFVIVLTIYLRPWRSAVEERPKDQGIHCMIVAEDESPLTSSNSAESARTKPRPRTNRPKPTIEETSELVRTTIVPLLDLPPNQPLTERVACINELIRDAGVESDRLRLMIRSADSALEIRSKSELRVREIPLAIVLKYLCDSTRLRYHIRENGIVELTTSQDPDPSPHTAEPESSSAEEKDDPFAETLPVR